MVDIHSACIERALTLINTSTSIVTNLFNIKLKHRAKTISSTSDILDKELNHIQCAHSVCGYTLGVWNSSASDKISPKPRSQDHTNPVSSITIPYVQGASEGLSRIIRKAGVTVHIKPTNTIP